MTELERLKANLECALNGLDGLPQALTDAGMNIESEIVSLCEAKLEVILTKVIGKINNQTPITLEQHLEHNWEANNNR